jgi:hypothetical protein
MWKATARRRRPATLTYLAEPHNGGPAIKALKRAIPGSWRRAAAGAVPAVPGEASRALLERMGWRLPEGGPLVGPPLAMRLHLEVVWARRAQLCARMALAAVVSPARAHPAGRPQGGMGLPVGA